MFFVVEEEYGDLNGDNTTAEAYYVTGLDITILADASINDNDTWDNQVAVVNSLEIGGVSGWRLPNADVNNDGTVINCVGGGVAGCEDNELQYLYWEEGITFEEPGPFFGVQSSKYWYSTGLGLVGAWVINYQNGGITADPKTSLNFLWPVHDGMVGGAVIPIPAAVWLFGSGLIGLISVARRKIP